MSTATRIDVAAQLNLIGADLRHDPYANGFDCLERVSDLIHRCVPVLVPMVMPLGGQIGELSAIVALAKASNATAPNLETAVSIVYYEAHIAALRSLLVA